MHARCKTHFHPPTNPGTPPQNSSSWRRFATAMPRQSRQPRPPRRLPPKHQAPSTNHLAASRAALYSSTDCKSIRYRAFPRSLFGFHAVICPVSTSAYTLPLSLYPSILQAACTVISCPVQSRRGRTTSDPSLCGVVSVSNSIIWLMPTSYHTRSPSINSECRMQSSELKTQNLPPRSPVPQLLVNPPQQIQPLRQRKKQHTGNRHPHANSKSGYRHRRAVFRAGI